MLTELINKNEPMPDPRAGSTPALAGKHPSFYTWWSDYLKAFFHVAYSAACLASQNITIPPTAIALTLPATWDGPLDIVMGLPGTIFTVIVGAFLGSSAILLLSNM